MSKKATEVGHVRNYDAFNRLLVVVVELVRRVKIRTYAKVALITFGLIILTEGFDTRFQESRRMKCDCSVLIPDN